MKTLLAANSSYWQWEYDSNCRGAYLYILDDNCQTLELEIKESWTKTGLGAGTTTVIKETVEAGTLSKPNLGLIRSLLAKHKHQTSRCSNGFSKLWIESNSGKSLPLKLILENRR